MIIQYVFAVIVDSLQSFKIWCDTNQLPFTGYNGRRSEYHGIEYIAVITPDDLRGFRIDGIVESETAQSNAYYNEIISVSYICFTA